MQKNTSLHPCFNKGASGSCGRVHLPVAPRCNIMCNYCNRKYDCVNESRPGVSSAVLKPAQALDYMEKVLEKEPRITVAGIAGPGDPFANPAETLETMRLLKRRFPHLLFCLSSNGLNIPPYLDDMAELGVTHATVTMNAVDPDIAAGIYSWVRDGNVVYRGRAAGELMLSRQLEAIEGLKKRGIAVKVNTIVIPGVNDHHVAEVAKLAGKLGADLQNLIPLYPNAETPFGVIREPGREEMRELRQTAGAHVTQMTHCRRCRADAVGMLCKDRSAEMAPVLAECAAMEIPHYERPFVAVATREGLLVNQHLGEAKSFQIWGRAEDGGFRLVEERESPAPGCGPKRWESLARTLSDCRAVLASAMGESPQQHLRQAGVRPLVCQGFIADVLDAVFGSGDISPYITRRKSVAAGCCSGGGEGCGG